MKNLDFVSETVEVKDGKDWTVSHIIKDPLRVYRDLCHALISKKINCCKYITRIRYASNYDGTCSIYVNYDNNVRVRFKIESH